MAEVALLPALRKQRAAAESRVDGHTGSPATAEVDAETSRLPVVLADGYSCRTQITDLSDADGVSLAELLAWGWELEPRR